MSTENIKASKATMAYWNSAKKIIGVVGKYVSADKLRVNLEDESTAWKVQRVFSQYYGSSSAALYKTISNYKSSFDKAVRVFNMQCQMMNVIGVVNADNLFELLKNEKRREFYMRVIGRKLKADEVVPLQEIEKQFRAH